MLPETETLESELRTQQIKTKIDNIVQQAKKDAHYDTGDLKKSIFGVIGNSVFVKRVKKTAVCEFEMLFYGVYGSENDPNSNLVELVPKEIYGHPTVIYFVTPTGERLDMTSSKKYVPKPQGKIRTYKPTVFITKPSKISKVPKISKQDNSGYTKFDFKNMITNFFNVNTSKT